MPADVAALARELMRACRRPLDTVFLRSTRRDDLEKYPTLTSEVRRIRPLDWDETPTATLIKVVRDAAASLNRTSGPKHYAGSWVDVAQLIIGAADPDDEILTYNERLALIAERHSPALGKDDAEKLRNEQIWPMLAQALVDMPVRQTAVSSPPSGKLAGEVDRADLYREARWAVDGAARLIVLWGESGNGKTYLARQLVRDEFAGRRVAVLREDSGTPSLFDRDLVDLLRECGHPAEQWSAAACESALAEMLNDHEAFDLIFFDNVDSGRFDDLLLSSNTKVLITSRERLTLPGAEHVRVAAYLPDEAVLAAERGFPDTPHDELAEFCEAVGNRPIVIDLASRLLRMDSGMTLTQIRDAVRLNAGSALDAAYRYIGGYTTPFGEQVSATVVEVYRRIGELLASRAAAVAILDTLLWLPRLSLREYIVTLTADPERGVDEFMAGGGFADLLHLGLIDVLDDGVVMNDLTRSLLRVILADRMTNAVGRFLIRCDNESLPTGWRDNMKRDRDPGTLLRRIREGYLAAETRIQLWAQYAANLYLSQRALGLLAPGRIAGVYQVAPNEAIVWQQDYELFSEIEPGTFDVAFVELAYKQAVVTTRRGQRRELAVRYATNVYKYLLITNSALREPGLHDDEPSWGYGAEFWPTRGDGSQHEVISMIPGVLAFRHNMQLWSTCGKLFVPGVEHALSDDLPPCPRCASFRDSDPSASNTFFDIVAMYWALDRENVTWTVLATLYATVAVLTWEAGGGLPEMPEDVLEGASSDRRGVALLVPWTYASYAHFLIRGEGATPDAIEQGMMSLQSAATALSVHESLLSDLDAYFLLEFMAELAATGGDWEWSQSLLAMADTRAPKDDR